MTFLEKIKSHLLSDDILVQETILYALHDYPNVPEEWTVALLKDAFQNEKKLDSILVYIENQTIGEEAVKVLIDNIPKMDKTLFVRVIDNINPELSLKYRKPLEPFIAPETWALYELVVNGSKEEVYTEYGKILSHLEKQEYHEYEPYSKAKKLARSIVQKGWISEDVIAKVIEDDLHEEWFSYEGILSVYMIGLMKIKNFIPVLASLLDRDEDILLEETAAALIAFQSDEVVSAVEPFVKNSESVIFAASVLENIKTDLAIQVLKEAYDGTETLDDKDIVFEALCHQFSREVIPVIADHMKKGHFSNMVDIEHTAYSFYTILGEQHPELGKWKLAALSNRGIIDVLKLGRNDPCPCGSGKKYKKCCGR